MFANFYRSNSVRLWWARTVYYYYYYYIYRRRLLDGCWIPRRDSVERSRLFTVAKMQTTLLVNRSSKIIIWLRYTERFINRDVKTYLVFRHETFWQYTNAITTYLRIYIYIQYRLQAAEPLGTKRRRDVSRYEKNKRIFKIIRRRVDVTATTGYIIWYLYIYTNVRGVLSAEMCENFFMKNNI